jgi:hypothetical protein
VIVAVVAAAHAAWADAGDDKLPLAEPIIGESISDIDATEAGETEISVIGAAAWRADDGAIMWGSELEVETRANAKLGVSAEVDLGGVVNGDPSEPAHEFSTRFAAAYSILQDFKHDLHVQLFGSARISFASEEEAARNPVLAFDPSVSSLPYVVGLHAGWRRGRLNLRATLTGGFGAPLNVPLAANVAVLVQGATRRINYFWGAEVNADGSRFAPFMVLPEASIEFLVGDVPLRIGALVPLIVGHSQSTFAAGGLLRIMISLGGDEEEELKRHRAAAGAPRD